MRSLATTTTTAEIETRPVVPQTRHNLPAVLLYGYFAYMTVEVFLFPMSIRERIVVVVLNMLIGATLVMLGRNAASQRGHFLAVVSDWLPCILILVAYREAGLLFIPDPSHRLDYLLIRWDEILLNSFWVKSALAVGSPWLQRYLEFSYFLCYPVVPLGVATLYLARSRGAPGFSPAHAARGRGATNRHHEPAVEHYWTAVLMAALACYVLFPLFPLTPPRELFHDLPGPGGASGLRSLNHWLLNRYAVGASLFPSGHVASATAAALAIHRYVPRAGLVFLLVAVSIALATVYGRYHYAADALAGAAVGVTAYLLSCRLAHFPQPKSA